jgi:hypothetical protein
MDGIATPQTILERVLLELQRAARGERGSDKEALEDLMGLAEFLWRGVNGDCRKGRGDGGGVDDDGGLDRIRRLDGSPTSGIASPSTLLGEEDEAFVAASRSLGKEKEGIVVAPFCQTALKAWLRSTASSEVVESLHPVSMARLCEKSNVWEQRGEVVLEGAEAVEVVFDGRSDLPRGLLLTLKGGNPNAGAPEALWDGKEEKESLVVWSSTGERIPGEFTTRLVFKGPRVLWSLRPAHEKRRKEGEQQTEPDMGGATETEEGVHGTLGPAWVPAETAGLPAGPMASSTRLARTEATPPSPTSSEVRKGSTERSRTSLLDAGLETKGETWGFGFTVLAKRITPSQSLARLVRQVQHHNCVVAFPSEWSLDQDVAVVEWLNTASEALGRAAVDVSPFDFRHGGRESSVGLHLEHCPLPAIYLRIALIQGFNQHIQRLLPFVDLANPCRHSLGAKLRALAPLVLRDVKMAVVEAGKERTQGSGGNSLTITLDNFAASRSMEAAERDVTTSRCIFVQAFRALHHKDSQVLRSCWDGDRVFQVTFRGENGSDAGGVFREGMSRVLEDLYSPETLNLLIPCPNAQHGLPTNTDKFLPNPQLATCPLALEMFEFVGKLMGMSLRANLCLPFHFPSLIWKRLLGHEVLRSDMDAVDTLTSRLLDSVRGCEDEAEFEGKFGGSLTFVATGYDGDEVELVPGGSMEDVTFATRQAYCDLLSERYLHDSDAQVGAMARGLYAVVARDTLLLLTWQELETLVCGSPTFDMAFWKAHTTYAGYSKDDLTIQLFWKVLESFSHEEQSGFVRFAWGRSRLPPKNAWYKNMQISRRNAGEDSLPASHTCFFSIELPPYQSEAAMRKGLLTAITYGAVGILNT